MEALTPADLEAEPDAYDAHVFATPGIDRFCSASEWVLAARAAWSPRAETWIRRGAHGHVLLLRHRDPGGVRILLGCDAMWGFSCPFVGGDPAALVAEAAAELRRAPWEVLLVPGAAEGSPLPRALAARLGTAPRKGPVLRRWTASLAGGAGAYLSRRSAKLRENLRRAERRARDERVTVEEGAGTAAELIARVVAVEERSWKGPTRTGLLAPEMRAFYDALAERLARRGRLRVLFARRDGEDVGYVLGGLREGICRGFQFSFDARLAHVSLGSLLLLRQVEAACAEGAETYDLGIDLPYKHRWADAPFDTLTLFFVRSLTQNEKGVHEMVL